jgi:hypothetical protein
MLREAFEGACKVLRSNYLLWMVGIVVAYESAAAQTDFVSTSSSNPPFTPSSSLPRCTDVWAGS